jgi:hypothetical protein
VARSHQRLVYDALLRCAAEAVLTLAQDPRHFGARPAVLAVLHTHGRDLGYHPHAHLLVSAGGLAGDRFVHAKRRRFLLPARVLSCLFRQKLRDALEDAELTSGLPGTLWNRRWVVHAQHAGTGQQALHYLGRYLYKSPLPNSRLERFEHGRITFRFRSHRTGNTVHQTLPALVFLHRLLQHVLPERLHHVRGYGLLAPTQHHALQRAHQLLGQPSVTAEPPHPDLDNDHSHTCPFCQHGRMRVVAPLSHEQIRARPIGPSHARSPP